MAQQRNPDGTFASKDAKFKTIFDEVDEILHKTRPYNLRYRIANNADNYVKDWYKSKVKLFPRKSSYAAVSKISEYIVPKMELGGLYLFQYDPYLESKEKMSAFDTQPLILPFSSGSHRITHKPYITAINFHYASVNVRFDILSKLIEIGNMSGIDKYKKLKLTYDMFRYETSIAEVKACIHHYVMENVKSNIIQIPIDEWKIAVTLPVARFRKMNEQAVWAESYRIAQNLKHSN